MPMEMCVLEILPSGMSYSATGCDVRNQQHNTVSSNRNIHETRLCKRLARIQPSISPRSKGSVFANIYMLTL